MIFAKIYSDGDDIVFESVKKEVKFYVDLAGEHEDGRIYVFTIISHTNHVAISREAKSTLEQVVSYQNPNFVTNPMLGRIQFTYSPREREGLRGNLYFVPDEGKFSYRMNTRGKIELSYLNGFDMRALDDMKIFDNEFLKKLDISEPFDESAYSNCEN